MGDKEYGDEMFIYAMVLMEEIEKREKETNNKEKQEGDEE